MRNSEAAAPNLTATKPDVKQCRDCGRLLPIENFSPSKRHKDGYVTQCHACKKHNLFISKKRWQQNNKEKHAEHNRKYRKKLEEQDQT